MNKSTPFAILILGLLSVQCGLHAAPALTAFADEAANNSVVNLSLTWMTVGIIGVVIGGFGIFWRRLL
jgi:hypothetical protein